MKQAKILIAGIGNIFLGDDAFGVEVASRLAGRALPVGVRVVDFGIRGFDLAFELVKGYDVAVLVDAAPRGHGPPGTLYLIEPATPSGAAELDNHAMDPVKVLRLAASLGAALPRVLLIGCEPMQVDGDMGAVMSPHVRQAIDPAVAMIEALIDRLLADASVDAAINASANDDLRTA